MGFLLLMLLPFLDAGVQNTPDARVIALLRIHSGTITSAALEHHIPPRLLASVVFAEQLLNVTPGEATLENIFARSGYNASLGPAQIKVATAEWLLTLDRCSALRGAVDSSGGIIEALIGPESNFRFAACYLGLIMDVWRMNSTSLSSEEVALAASLYALGLVRSDGSIRVPHPDAAPNTFGVVAAEFYFSRDLIEVLPRPR